MLRLALQCVSWLALVATLLPSILFLAGSINLTTCSGLMLGATLVWFAATPCWMGRESTP
jgi:hypothetical protein